MELVISAKSRENGALKSVRHSLNGEVTLGRGPESPLPLEGTGISRDHLRLHLEGDDLFVTDLSSNGTWLNVRRLTHGEPHAVAPADAIQIPGFEIRIERPGPAASEPQQGHTLLGYVAALPAALSTVERFVIALGLATMALLLLYLTG